MINPKVAVITRTKDRTPLLRRAIESVLAQTFEDWAMVIVNDGGLRAPVDDLGEAYKDRFEGRLRVFHNERSIGMEAASNIGLKGSESSYVVIHDDDDSWHPTFMKRCVEFMETNPYPSVAGVVTRTVEVVERIEGDRIIIEKQKPFNAWCESITLYRMAAGNIFPPISFLYDRRVLDRIGYYREDLPVLGDWEFNLRFLLQYDIMMIPDDLAFYHHRRQSKDGAYSNSVVGENRIHRLHDTLLRNALLRDDLAYNRIGMGYLVNIGKSIENVHWRLSGLMVVIDKLRKIRWVKALLKRLIRDHPTVHE